MTIFSLLTVGATLVALSSAELITTEIIEGLVSTGVSCLVNQTGYDDPTLGN